MPRKKLPRFHSLRQEREFWQTHDVFEVLGDDGWHVVEPGEVRVDSVYVSRVDRRGTTVRVPKELLDRMGAKPGSCLRARVIRRKLVIESVPGSRAPEPA